jgi:hypothetical protein
MISTEQIELGAAHLIGWLERWTKDKRTLADEEFAAASLDLLRTRIQPIAATPEGQRWLSALSGMVAANAPASQPIAAPSDPQPSEPAVIMTTGGHYEPNPDAQQ